MNQQDRCSLSQRWILYFGWQERKNNSPGELFRLAVALLFWAAPRNAESQFLATACPFRRSCLPKCSRFPQCNLEAFLFLSDLDLILASEPAQSKTRNLTGGVQLFFQLGQRLGTIVVQYVPSLSSGFDNLCLYVHFLLTSLIYRPRMPQTLGLSTSAFGTCIRPPGRPKALGNIGV